MTAAIVIAAHVAERRRRVVHRYTAADALPLHRRAGRRGAARTRRQRLAARVDRPRDGRGRGGAHRRAGRAAARGAARHPEVRTRRRISEDRPHQRPAARRRLCRAGVAGRRRRGPAAVPPGRLRRQARRTRLRAADEDRSPGQGCRRADPAVRAPAWHSTPSRRTESAGTRPSACRSTEHPPRQVAAEFEQMLAGHAVAGQDDAGPGRLPGALPECARSPTGWKSTSTGRSWSSGSRRCCGSTTSCCTRCPTAGRARWALANRQIYASHYFQNALEVRLLVDDPAQQGRAHYLMVLNVARPDGHDGPVWRPGALQDPQRLARGAAQDTGRHQAAMRGARYVGRNFTDVGRNFSSGIAHSGKQRRRSFVDR